MATHTHALRPIFSSPIPSSLRRHERGFCRSGVILLVLLGMLGLFSATAFAFVVVASHAKRVTRSLQKVQQSIPVSPEDELEAAILQVIRGPGDSSTSSVLRRHSLLEDIYGGDQAWIRGWVINRYTVAPRGSRDRNPKGLHNVILPGTPMPARSYVAAMGGGQIIEFTAGFTVPQYGPVGGLDPISGQPATIGIEAPETLTVPPWFGTSGNNYSGITPIRNDSVAFQRRVGSVLTILDPASPAYHKSTRIVGYRRIEIPDKVTRLASSPPLPIDVVYHCYQILPFDGISTDEICAYFHNTEYAGIDYMINGAPFSGTGAGYDPSTGRSDGAYPPVVGIELPYALLPDTTDPEYHEDLGSYSANEDYDAPDYQNMLLAMEQAGGGPDTLTRSPSLHRPALANYWLHRIMDAVSAPSQADKLRLVIQPYGRDGVRNTGDENLNLFSLEVRDAVVTIKRRCLLRPIAETHRSFDGSNTNWPSYIGQELPQGDNERDVAKLEVMARQVWGVADLKPGLTSPWFIDFDNDGVPDREVVPWDVDNDGDGVADSIWVNIGLPVRAAKDGNLCRPLVAIHCVDLDGKVNLNTAGGNEQLYQDYRRVLKAADPNGYLADGTVYAQPILQGDVPGADVELPRGQGCGTAEISPQPLFGYGRYENFRNLLLGVRSDSIDGRYGEVKERLPEPQYNAPAPGRTYEFDNPERLMMNQLAGFPRNYWQAVASSTPTAYGSPMDLKGAMTVGLDYFGQPIYSTLRAVPSSLRSSGCAIGWNSDAWNAAHLNTPYELKLGASVPQSVGSNASLDNSFTIAEYERLLRPYDVDIYSQPDRLQQLLRAGFSSYFRLRATTESWDLPVPNLALPPQLRKALGSPPLHTTDLLAAKLLELHSKHLDALPESTYFYPRPETVDMAALVSSDVLSGLRFDLNRPFGDGKDNDSNYVVDEPGEIGDEATGYRLVYARTLYVLMMALVDPDWYPPWDEEVIAAADGGRAKTCRAEARARALAQWAINIVDFRDADSIMTPFVYDPYPFAVDGTAVDEFPAGIDRDSNLRAKLLNTWSVDGPDRRIVWGCERPELVITETLAFHDRRTEDTAADSTGETVADGDNDFDQCYPPQGSLFVELYNPWTDAEPGPSEFHCNRKTGDDAGGVILSQVTRPNSTTRRVNPVWRLLVARGPEESPRTYADPDLKLGGHCPSRDASLDASVERIVYFVPETDSDLVVPDRYDPDPAEPNWVTFVPRYGTDTVIEPHRYCVIGPGTETRDSSGAAVTSPVTYVGDGDDPATTRRIVLNPSGRRPVCVFGNGTIDDLTELGDAICTPSSVLIDQALTRDEPVSRRLSVSEPLEGYTEPVWDAEEMVFKYDPPLDLPEDKEDETHWRESSVLGVNGTTPCYRYLHLQRLANPEQPYDSETNPYLTIDTSAVDLTVFNGRDPSSDGEIESGTWAFNSRQRGEDGGALWSTKIPARDDMPQPTGTPKTVAAHIFAEPFSHTLGYVNGHFGEPLDPSVFGLASYRGAPGRIEESDDGSSKTFRPNPFAWLTWLNRPFANPMELMQVPATRSSRLLVSYENDAMNVADLRTYQAGQDHFAHLLGFFGSLPGQARTGQMRGSPRPEGEEDLSPDAAPHLYRLFEYVHVPSRFIGSHIQPDTELMSDPDEPHSFHPPYHFISTYREPGKINLNTVFGNDGWRGNDSTVWWCLLNDHNSVPWTSFVDARRAYPGADCHLDTDSVPLPTRLANPFRSFAGVDLVPPIPGRDSNEETSYLAETIQQGANATLLRASVGTAGPLETLDTRDPLFTTHGTSDFADSTKTPFFQYQSLQRLSNLTTTRSNVYAVWITVGYFYVSQYPGYNPNNAIHRQLYGDGYMLGKEVGSHKGTVSRHRGFYLIDRSIPVGFVPGENLNVDDTILVRRFIE